MHAAADRGAPRLLLPGGDGGEGETCGESSSRGGAGGGGGGGGGGTAAAAVSWRGGRMRRPPLRFVGASGFLMPPLAPCPRSRRGSLWTCGSDDSRESRRDDIWGRKRGVPRRGEGRRRRASGKMSSEEEEKRLSRSRALSPARSSSPMLEKELIYDSRLLPEDRPRGEEAERGERGSIVFCLFSGQSSR